MTDKIIAIEGNSFSGKTTLIRDINRSGLPTIGEYNVYAGNGYAVPAFPPRSYSEAKTSVDFFIGLEERRSSDTVRLIEHGSNQVIMDRSPFSCILFQKLVRDLFPSIPEAYEYCIDSFLEAYQAEKIVLPTALIHIKPSSSAEFLRRVSERGRVHFDFLNEPVVDETIHNWYENEVFDQVPPESRLTIPSYKDQQGLVFHTAMDFIQRCSPFKHMNKAIRQLATNIYFK